MEKKDEKAVSKTINETGTTKARRAAKVDPNAGTRQYTRVDPVTKARVAGHFPDHERAAREKAGWELSGQK